MMCARVKAKRPKEAATGGKVLSVWLYDREADKTIWKVDIPSDKATGAYEWYDLGEWIEEGSDCSLLFDTYGGVFSIDCVEIRKENDIQEVAR